MIDKQNAREILDSMFKKELESLLKISDFEGMTVVLSARRELTEVLVTPKPVVPTATAYGHLYGSLIHQVLVYSIKDGNRVAAIKHIREKTGFGLYDAKILSDYIQATYYGTGHSRDNDVARAKYSYMETAIQDGVLNYKRQYAA